MSKDQKASESGIELHLFEWSGNTAGREHDGLRSIEELESESEGTVRVM